MSFRPTALLSTAVAIVGSGVLVALWSGAAFAQAAGVTTAIPAAPPVDADPIPAGLLPPGLAAPVSGPATGLDAPMPPPPVPDVGTVFTADQQAAINTLIGAYVAANPTFIRDYLVNNPEVIQDAVTELEARQLDAQAQAQAQAIAQYHDEIFDSPRQAVIGNPDGAITLVEFFDYNCTYCKRSLPDINQLIAEDPDLRVVLKEFPVLGTGSTEAAQVAAAVILVAPDKYNDFHQLLLGSAAPATGDLAMQAATQVGIDQAALTTAMQSNEIVATIQEAYVVAGALGLTGTPSFVLGDSVIVGAVGYDALKGMIDSMRNCGETTCT